MHANWHYNEKFTLCSKSVKCSFLENFTHFIISEMISCQEWHLPTLTSSSSMVQLAKYDVIIFHAIKLLARHFHCEAHISQEIKFLITTEKIMTVYVNLVCNI